MKTALFRAALVAAAAVVLLPAAAGAATVTIDDATDDVYLAKYDETTDTTTYEPVGTQVNVDLDEVAVKHGARKVAVTAQYVDLARTTNRYMYLLRLRTNEGIKRDVTVDTLMAGWDGAVTFGKPNGAEVRCRGLAFAIDYAADTVSVTIPRRCLGNPRYVEAFTVAAGFSRSGDSYFDHGHTSGMKEKVMWSERIRKG
jgi:hypothetical protein